MIFNVIHELISDMTIHITTYDTCAYVDKLSLIHISEPTRPY